MLKNPAQKACLVTIDVKDRRAAEFSSAAFLLSQLAIEEVGHQVMGFFGLRQVPFIPEGVPEAVKDDQLRVDAGIARRRDAG